MDSKTQQTPANPVTVMVVGSDGLLGRASRYWQAPFRYEAEGSRILDARGEMLLDVRGWGRLTGRGACGLSLNDAVAESIQDEVGAFVARLLTDRWPNV